MTRSRLCSLALMLLVPFLSTLVRAQPAAGPLPIAPFIDETALLVGELDVGAIDPVALFDWATNIAKLAGLPPKDQAQMARDLGGATPMVKSWVADFGKAGGKKIYLIAIANQKTPFYAVIPTSGADAAKLKTLVETGLPKNMTQGTVVLQTEKGLIWGPPGAVELAKEIYNTPDRSTRPDIAAALAAAGNAPARVAFAPTEAIKGVVVLGQPTLPPQLGGGSTGALVNAFKYASFAIDLPAAAKPKVGVRMLIQARDEAGAQKLKTTIDTIWTNAKADAGFGKMPERDKLVAMLTPKAAGDKLSLAFDGDQIETLAKTIAPGLMAARQQATRAASMSNLRQLAVASYVYSTENKDQVPQKFPDDLTKYLGKDPEANKQVLTNPMQPAKTPGYVYLRPAVAKVTQIRDPATTPMLHEAFDAWPAGGIAVAFWDGHVETIADQAAFEKLLVPAPK